MNLKVHPTFQPIVFEKYTVMEYEETPDGKFGGYKVVPRLIPTEFQSKLYPNRWRG